MNMDDELIRGECRFYSALARFFMKHPKVSSRVIKANIADIAARWSAGEELTQENVTCASTVVESGGVSLHNFNEPAGEDTENEVDGAECSDVVSGKDSEDESRILLPVNGLVREDLADYGILCLGRES